MQYMTHPKHGATFTYDQNETEFLEKRGWIKGEIPSADEVRAQKAGARKEQLKAELAALEEVKPVEVKAKAKPGRKKKVVEA